MKAKHLLTLALAAMVNPIHSGMAGLGGGSKKERKPQYPFSLLEQARLAELTGKEKKAYIRELKQKYARRAYEG